MHAKGVEQRIGSITANTHLRGANEKFASFLCPQNQPSLALVAEELPPETDCPLPGMKIALLGVKFSVLLLFCSVLLLFCS